ncbi:MAG: hypothetical protein K9G34_08375, partial [Melioribacteraceae bacterium]|nr:hypothetical protein [Melioribacteraceae bacterium]
MRIAQRILLVDQVEISRRNFNRQYKPDITRGFGFLVEDQDPIFFHINDMPEDVKKLIDFRQIKDVSLIPSKIPQLSFEVADEDEKRRAVDIQIYNTTLNGLLFYDGKKFISPNSVNLFRCSVNRKLKPRRFYSVSYSKTITQSGLGDEYWITGIEELNSFIAPFDNLSNGILNPFFLTELTEYIFQQLVSLDVLDELVKLIRINPEIKKVFLEKFHEQDFNVNTALIDLLNHIDSNYANKYYLNQIEPIIDKKDYVFIDIESNGKIIHEISYIAHGELKTTKNLDKSKSEELIQQLSKDYSEYVFIGHNILKWDLPILAEFGLYNIDVNNVWDTILVECLLEPIKQSYALNSAHTAESDVLLAKKLFISQIMRILCSKELSFDYLGRNKVFSDLCEEYFRFFENVDDSVLEKFREQSHKFFKKNNNAELLELDFTNRGRKNLIIIPTCLLSNFNHIPNSRIATKYFTYYNSSKIPVEQITESDFLFTFFKNFSHELEVENIGKSLSLIPPFIRMNFKIERDLFSGPTIPLSIESIENEFSENVNTIFMDIFTYRSIIYEKLNILKEEINIFFLSKKMLSEDVLNLGSLKSELLLESLSEDEKFALIRSVNNKSPISVSTLPLIVESKSILDFSSVYARKIDNVFYFYVKVESDKIFRMTEEIPFSHYFISNKNHSVTVPNLLFDKSREDGQDLFALSNSSKYRSHYWSYNSLVIELIFANHPGGPEFLPIIVLNEDSETKIVSKIFQTLGYTVFTEPQELSTFRIDILHTTLMLTTRKDIVSILKSSTVKMIFIFQTVQCEATRILNDVDKELIENPSDNEDVENDSFDQPENEEELTETQPRNFVKPTSKLEEDQIDTFLILSHLILQSKHLNTIYLLENNLSEELKHINQNTVDLKIWDDKSVFLERKRKIDALFNNNKPELEYDFDTMKKTIESTFLKSKGLNGANGSLTEIQERYLKSILSKDSNSILVSLPTGGGKSILFQGPALLKG